MKAFFQKHHRLLFYSAWIILGLIQSGLTELQDDEAYYWVYSRFLDWGYFDHPPMIALLVKMGYAVFPNELGVRLFPLLLNVFSLVIIEKLIINKNVFLFYTIALSIAVLQLGGFIAVPDIPLIFFTALFFWFYKKFIANITLLNSLMLGASVALLFYSKYHALLIVVFTLLSNIRLLTKYQTYLAGLVALLLFAPHLWWQYQHDWVSIRYHLFESNVNPYRISFTADYIFGQLLLPGPIAGFILLPAAFLYKPKRASDSYRIEKALQYTMIGIYAFFFLSTFRGKVEGNWTSPVLVSLIVLSHQFLNERFKWQRMLFRLLPITLGLVLLARIIMIVDIVPSNEIQKRYHAWKTWPEQMKEKTSGLPVLFNNSYQRASKYWFYTGQMTYSQNWIRERKNNYNFWPVEDSMLGKPFYLLDIFNVFRFPDSLKTPIGWVGYKYQTELISFAKINIETSPKKISIKAGEEAILNCRFEISEYYAAFIRSHQDLHDRTSISVFKNSVWIKDIPTFFSLGQMITEKQAELEFMPELPAGKYVLRFSINSGQGVPTHNSDKIELLIN
jgi:hypothetical protein